VRACYAEATMQASIERPAPRFLTATWRALAAACRALRFWPTARRSWCAGVRHCAGPWPES